MPLITINKERDGWRLYVLDDGGNELERSHAYPSFEECQTAAEGLRLERDELADARITSHGDTNVP